MFGWQPDRRRGTDHRAAAVSQALLIEDLGGPIASTTCCVGTWILSTSGTASGLASASEVTGWLKAAMGADGAGNAAGLPAVAGLLEGRRERGCWAAIGQLKGQKQGREGGHSVVGVPPWLRKLCFKCGIERLQKHRSASINTLPVSGVTDMAAKEGGRRAQTWHWVSGAGSLRPHGRAAP